jgi:hypothetical protein
VAAPFTEWIALGALAIKLNAKLEWDGEKMKVTNNDDANKLLNPHVRKGWKLS